MTHSPIRLATRGSQLALWQANWVRQQLQPQPCELVIVETQGDRQQILFTEMNGQGFFTKAVQNAVLEHRADVAVHSLKDLPSAQTAGLSLAAISQREDPREILVMQKNCFDSKANIMPIVEGARLGTSAARRRAQVASLRPDIVLQEMRGNVPTRIQKLLDTTTNLNAVLLAAAGIKRLGLNLSDFATCLLDPDLFVPAPGQGALALECRQNDESIKNILKPLENQQAREATSIERGLMAKLNGGCQLALGAHVRSDETGQPVLRAWYNGKIFVTRGNKDEMIETTYQDIITFFPEAANP